MYQLDAPIYFYVFAMLPVLWLGYLWISAWKRKAQEQFASSRLMEVLSPERSRLKPLLKLILISLGVSCLILGEDVTFLYEYLNELDVVGFMAQQGFLGYESLIIDARFVVD